MAIRFAAVSGLALATALIVAPAARAQSFFSYYDLSPRQVVGMLQDDGYALRGPMVRRGDVYLVNVDSVSGRSMRLIVSARDGRVLERFATAPRWRSDDEARVSRPPNDDGDRDDEVLHRDRMALGDVLNPPSRSYGSDSLFPTRPTPPASVPDAPHKSKHHAAKKHHEPAIAKSPDEKDSGASMAAVAPSGDAPKSPAVQTVKPAETPAAIETPKSVETPRAVEAPREPAKPVEASRPAEPAKPPEASKPAPSPQPVQAKAEPEKLEPAPVKPKPDPSKKKINDLPVGTLD